MKLGNSAARAGSQIGLAVGALMFIATAGAQTPSTTPEASAHPQYGTDSDAPSHVTQVPKMAHGVAPDTFVEKASQDGMTEVKMAHLALANSKNAEVRKFATQMQREHGEANASLASIAANKNIRIPTALDHDHQAMLSEMSSKTGPAFDAAYANHMVMAHKDALELFQAAAKSSDNDIAAWANKMLPTLQQHQMKANGLQSKLKVAAADDAAASSRR
jgi:putative membrane protein